MMSSIDTAKLLRKSEDAKAFFTARALPSMSMAKEDTDERLIPFDLVPWIISASEWQTLKRGIEQCVKALNAFLMTFITYHRQEI